MIDSDATAHMSPYRDGFIGHVTFSSGTEVTIANGKNLLVAGKDKILLKYTQVKRVHVAKALHITGLDRRLMFVGKLADQGIRAQFRQNS